MQPVRIPQEETCPVPDHLLGELYRSKSHELDGLIETVPARTRAMLALYCYGRAHLQSIAFAVAATCEERHLEEFGGQAGVALFKKSRAMPATARTSHFAERKKVSLSHGNILQVVIDQDLI
jgi:hypothetical protein